MVAINFMLSKDNDKNRVIHSKRENIEIMVNEKADEVIEEHFQSLLSRYQIGSEISMKSSDLSLALFIYSVANFIKLILIKLDHMYILLIG